MAKAAHMARWHKCCANTHAACLSRTLASCSGGITIRLSAYSTDAREHLHLGAFSSCTFPGHRGRERRAIGACLAEDQMGWLFEGQEALCAKVIIQANLDRIGRQIITIAEISI